MANAAQLMQARFKATNQPIKEASLVPEDTRDLYKAMISIYSYKMEYIDKLKLGQFFGLLIKGEGEE